MQKRNGYFQVIRNSNGTSVRLIPPMYGGEEVKSEQIVKYLQKNQIMECDFAKITKALADLTTEVIVPVSNYKGYPINECMNIEVSKDSMTAVVNFIPPSNDGKRMNLGDMKSELEAAGIQYGIDEGGLASHTRNPVYCTDIIVARGKAVREGTHAFITYMFKIDRKAKPKRKDDGSVDFHQLENISHIKKGDLLAKLTPADSGESGINVFGQEVKPRAVERLRLKYGKNITISDNRLELYSDVDGHAVLEGDKVFVSNVYDVPGDVDNSTGDIIYDGSVVVHGTIRTGFKVKAFGDIEVFGAVEGAEVIAGGQVILHHGIQGMSRGIIVAKGNVVTKFIESAKVYSEGYIEAQSIIQSQVSAKGDVIVNGAKGNIMGGHVRSSTLIDAKFIGSNMGITTVVEVGLDPTVQDRFTKLKRDMIEKNEELIRLQQVKMVLKKRLAQGQNDNEKRMAYNQTVAAIDELKKEIFAAQDEMDVLSGELSENTVARIMVSRVIYPGTKVIVSGLQYNVNEQVSYCQYMKLKGEIFISPLT